MSGPVRNHSRRLRATALASPYAKKPVAAQLKSSGWTIGGILSALNPFKRAQSTEMDEDDYEAQQGEEDYKEEERPYTPPPPAAALSMRGREMAGETPAKPIDIDALSASPSAQSNNAEVVARYLAESKGRSLAEQEIHTLVSLLRSPTHDQPHQPRKLELSPAPSPSALRAAAPLPFSFAAPPSPAPANPFDFSSISISQSQTQSQEEKKPKRTIPRDPNAPIYKFTGAGSAKQNAAARPRTRYVSPAFGSPARRGRDGPGITLSPPPAQKGDAKRRKLQERAAGVGSAPSSPAKSGAVNGSPAKGQEKSKEKEKEEEPQMPATPRPRHAVAVVRAGMGAPAVPSPLRNGWHASPDSSPGSPSSAKRPTTNGNGNGISGLGMGNGSGLSTPSKPRAVSSVNSMSISPARSLNGVDEKETQKPRSTPTKAAATLSALIAETAPPPPPRPEVANPYQAALPARVQQRRPARKRKAEAISTVKSASDDEGEKKGDESKKVGEGKKGVGKEEEIGLDRIIEATVPKGSKRARPPPDLAAPKSSSTSFSTGEPRRSARLKSPEPSLPASKQTYRSLFEEKPKTDGKPVVEEIDVDEEEDEIVEMSPPKKAKTSSSSAFGTGASPAFGTGAGATTNIFDSHSGATQATSFGRATKSSGFGGLGNGLPSSQPSSFSSSADSIVVQEVSTPSAAPSLVAKPTEVLEPEDTGKAKDAGKGKPPAFAPRAPSKLRFATVADEEKDAEEKKADAPPPPLFDAKLFASTVASAAAGTNITSAAAAAGNAKDPKAATAALAIPATSLPTFAFRVVAATGPIMPSVSGSMDVDVPVQDEKAKDAARKVDVAILPSFAFNANLPASSPGAGPSKLSPGGGSGGFNWAAAGMKAPASNAGGWTCGTCMVPNKADAAKCVSCEEPAPKSAASATTGASTNGGGGGGFNWAAAGMKAPATNVGGWTCGTCMVPNKAEAGKCVSCEEPAPKFTSAASTPSSTAGGGGSGGGFNWAAAGMKAPTKDVGGWTCGVCMVPNKAGAGKCVACDSDRA